MSYLGPVSSNQDGTIINYIPYGTIENNTTRGWSACTLTWSGTTPSGAPTLTATQMAISASSVSPLSSLYSLLLTKSAANAQYQGFVSDAFTIKREDLAKVLTGSFYYEVASGTVDMSGTSTQSLEIWVYNVNANQWIQPAGYRGLNQSSGPGLVSFTFQTDSTPANNSYRIAVITQQTSTTAYTVKFDNFKLGPQTAPIVQLRNPVGTIISTGSLTPPNGYLYCNGALLNRSDYAELFAAIGTTYNTGGETATQFRIPDLRGIFARGAGTNPSNASNTTTMGNRQLDDFKSHSHAALSSAINSGGGTAFNTASTAGIAYSVPTSSVGGTETRPANVGVAYHICFSSGNVQTSDSTDTRVVAARYTLSAPQSIPNGVLTDIVFNSRTFDSHAGMNTSTGVYTIPVSGYYAFKIGQRWGSAAAGIRYVQPIITGASASFITPYNVFNNNTDFVTNSASDTLFFNAGDTIKIQGFQNSGGALAFQPSGNAYFEIERLSGPSVVAASETVAMRAIKNSGAQTSNNNLQNIASFNSIVQDTHGIFNLSTGVATVPISGTYLCTFQVSFVANSNGARVARLLRNGNMEAEGNIYLSWADRPVMIGTALLKCNAGDTLNLQAYQTSGGNLNYDTTLNNSTNFNIVRVGN